jgi:hypothetical protein
LCTTILSYILVEKAKSNVKDRKEAILKLYDSLLIYAEFIKVNEDDFYELLDKVSPIFIILFLVFLVISIYISFILSF